MLLCYVLNCDWHVVLNFSYSFTPPPKQMAFKLHLNFHLNKTMVSRGQCFNVQVVCKLKHVTWFRYQYTCQDCPGLSRSPLWKSMGFLEMSRLTWWCTRNVLPYCITAILIFFVIIIFAPPAPFLDFINWTCHYITDKELINLPWLLASFAPDWMFAMSSLNPQNFFPTRPLPRSHVHFWNPTMDLTSWLGSSNLL